MSTNKLTQNKLTLSVTSDTEVIMTRVFDAPRDLVFKAFTDPEMIPQWWGYPTRVDKMDVRPGGQWRFLHRAPDGNEYGIHGDYREVIPPEKIVQTFEFEGRPGPVQVDTLVLEELGVKTKMTVTSVFQSVEHRDGILKSGMEKGAAGTYDRLEELLVKKMKEES